MCDNLKQVSEKLESIKNYVDSLILNDADISPKTINGLNSGLTVVFELFEKDVVNDLVKHQEKCISSLAC